MNPLALVMLGTAAALSVTGATSKQRRTTTGVAPTRAKTADTQAAKDSLFPESIPDRDAFILAAVKRGEADIRWSPVRATDKGNQGEFRVFADAMKISGVRVNLTARGQQRVADALGCMLLTLKLADLIWAQRQAELPPIEMSQTEHDLQIMSTVGRMILHSQKIDEHIAALPHPPEGIVCTVGKHWVIDDRLLSPKNKGMAENYGWQNPKQGPICATPSGGKGCHVVQDPGWWHNLGHTDYSQTCVLVSRDCKVNGDKKDLMAVLQDPVFAYLASHTGPMKVLRQPGT